MKNEPLHCPENQSALGITAPSSVCIVNYVLYAWRLLEGSVMFQNVQLCFSSLHSLST